MAAGGLALLDIRTGLRAKAHPRATTRRIGPLDIVALPLRGLTGNLSSRRDRLSRLEDQAHVALGSFMILPLARVAVVEVNSVKPAVVSDVAENRVRPGVVESLSDEAVIVDPQHYMEASVMDRPRSNAIKVVLVSTYELGRQPFGLASPAAWLRRAGIHVDCLDLAREKLNPQLLSAANLVAFYLPMHTATRIALHVIKRVRALNPTAHLCAYGLYAPLNSEFLREVGIQTILGGEFEDGLVALAEGLANADERRISSLQEVALNRLTFIAPDRRGLPVLSGYAGLIMPDGGRRVVGYTEASRGCKHLCRHCPIVPVYEGRFRVVQRDVVMSDIQALVAAGAEHVCFGDPDFFNGIKHATSLVRELHAQFPNVTYDVTIKVEHLLNHRQYLPLLRETGCSFVTSAVEAVDDGVLKYFDKGHTRRDFIDVVHLFREVDLVLAPTFVTFHPWITLEGYVDLLQTIDALDLVENVAPIQYAIRLLIPAHSKLLDLPEVQEIVGEFDRQLLSHTWRHNDPRVDALQIELQTLIEELSQENRSRADIFNEILSRVRPLVTGKASLPPDLPRVRPLVTIPYMTEPWFC